MTTRRSREAAYADLVAGILDVRPDLATDRFDAELAAAEEDGRIDPQTAKVLRWWQRESLRALVEHARSVVPPTLMALETSAQGAEREVEASSRSWARAVGDDSGTLPSAYASPAAPASSGYATTSAYASYVAQPPEPSRTPAGAAAGHDADRAGDVDDTDDIDDIEPQPLPPPTDLSEHRRRLLVAGLTRVRNPT